MKLKPCPFCGEKEDIVIRTRVEKEPLSLRGYKYSYVECLPCDARTGRMYDADCKMEGFENSEEQATFYWNMRDGKVDKEDKPQ